MNPCCPPSFLQSDLKDQDLEHLKVKGFMHSGKKNKNKNIHKFSVLLICKCYSFHSNACPSDLILQSSFLTWTAFAVIKVRLPLWLVPNSRKWVTGHVILKVFRFFRCLKKAAQCDVPTSEKHICEMENCWSDVFLRFDLSEHRCDFE